MGRPIDAKRGPLFDFPLERPITQITGIILEPLARTDYCTSDSGSCKRIISNVPPEPHMANLFPRKCDRLGKQTFLNHNLSLWKRCLPLGLVRKRCLPLNLDYLLLERRRAANNREVTDGETRVTTHDLRVYCCTPTILDTLTTRKRQRKYYNHAVFTSPSVPENRGELLRQLI